MEVNSGSLQAARAAARGDNSAFDLQTELERCSDELGAAAERLNEHLKRSQQVGLNNNPLIQQTLIDQVSQVRRIIQEDLGGAESSNATEDMLRREALLRWGLQALAYCKSSLEWKAPAYAQSKLNQHFDSRAQNNTGVNYDRYESPDVLELEERLTQVLNLDRKRQTLLVCSSGMGAYTLIESYLLRDVFWRCPKVVLPPYIYFECTEQLLSIPRLECFHSASFEATEIASLVSKTQAEVVFADPVANDLCQRKVDLPKLFSSLREQAKLQHSLVIDGTMTSGCLEASLLRSDEKLRVFYFEGCNKYLQHGLDLNMAGLVVVPRELRTRFEQLRRNCGVNLPRPAAQAFPQVTRASHLERMRSIEAVAFEITEKLSAQLAAPDSIEVICSSHPSHPDYSLRSHLFFNGGCITFRIFDSKKAQRENLNQFISNLLQQAEQQGVYISKGVSFGFSFPRISAAASMAGTIDPFLRLYVGHPPPEQVEKLVGVLTKCFQSYLML